MNRVLIVLLLLSSFAATGANHLQPLGERGIYIFDGSEQLVNSLRKESFSIEAIQIVYPSFDQMRLVLIAQDYDSENYFLITAVKNGDNSNHTTLKLKKSIAESIVDAFNTVLSETKVDSENPVLGTDGTIYAFYSFPFAGYRWNKGNDDKPAFLIELCEKLESLSRSKHRSGTEAEIESLTKAITGQDIP